MILHLSLMRWGSGLAALSMLYSIMAWWAVRRPIQLATGSLGYQPPVTLLKPLCGADIETYACLRSFCEQRYPNFQIVFGVAEAADPAVAIVARLQLEYPHVNIQLSVNRRQHGSNRKVSNLLNMMPLARHGVLVLADSDVWVTPDYLARVVNPLSDHKVGIVTCSYQGRRREGFWSLLGALFINDWFVPSVRVAAWGGSRSFAFGATIAIRREILSKIGGFTSVANQLADDYRLGELTRRAGLRTVLSDVVVETMVAETTFDQLMRHELRWLRTIRAVNPVGFGFSFLTFSFPIVVFGCMLAEGSLTTLGILLLTTMARVSLHLRTRTHGWRLGHAFLLPFRDLLSLGLWGWSLVARRVQWRDSHFQVARDGSVQLVEGV